jgi:tetratricopeptide (TPR) repeat protein
VNAPPTTSQPEEPGTSVPFDGPARLRAAEKLLRVGKLEPAIEIYREIVRECPDDLDTPLTLAGLYLRTGAIDQAINHLTGLAERRHRQNDRRGAAEIYIRIATLDPDNLAARLIAARARQEIGDTAGAIADLKALVSTLLDRGRHTDASAVLREAAMLDPTDTSVHEQLFDADILCGNFAEARELASTPAQWKRLGTTMAAVDPDNAVDVLREAAARNPSDFAVGACLARIFVSQGKAAEAASYLRPEMAGGDPQLMLAIAEIQLRGNCPDDGIALARLCVDTDSRYASEVASLAVDIADLQGGPAWQLLEVAVDAWTQQQDWRSAAEALEQFVSTSPQIPALVRLIEVAIDAGMDELASRAAAQLADAYVASGAAADALMIVEDLVFRDPQNEENLARFRHVLSLLGEVDPEAAIARRLGAAQLLRPLG